MQSIGAFEVGWYPQCDEVDVDAVGSSSDEVHPESEVCFVCGRQSCCAMEACFSFG